MFVELIFGGDSGWLGDETDFDAEVGITFVMAWFMKGLYHCAKCSQMSNR